MSVTGSRKKLAPENQQVLLSTLKSRFVNNMNRHEGIDWEEIMKKLFNNGEKLWSLNEMERSGGEPDVTGYDSKTDRFVLMDCSPQSPAGRRNICYDREGRESRKEHKPESSAEELAASMGIELLTEEQYRYLQTLGEFDTSSSSWIKTPSAIRKHGGALFCDRRYNHVFVYHNGAQSYYGSRGFRAVLYV
ncbi:MAG: DUF4256 domain-containing protein [Bacteroidales bacterium]|nr:DUF4256 domain-containing protein [Bacteroidales bacterium]MBN2631974.1 DUF4256 domain-containing protein [Bacteroidales bacterium]